MAKISFKRMCKDQKGITGLETAIILIAFVVVAAVFAYTVLSAGLFSTQKSQEAVYSGLSEAQSSLEVKGGVIANGRASMDNADFVGWAADSDVTLARETTTKWQGAASLSAVVAAGATLNDTLIYRAMQPLSLSDGDTLTFWIKADAALDNNITFALGTGANLQGTATQAYAINTSGTGWEKHTVTFSGGNDTADVYFGVYLSTDAAGTFYLDNIVFDSIADIGGIPVALDSCDWTTWAADSDVTLTRETTDKIEGSGSLKAVVATDGSLNDTLLYRAMAAKDWTNDDTITFWVKAAAALDSNITFAIGTGVDLQATATETQLINPSGTGWEKYTMTLSGGDDDSSVYFGVYLSTDAEGTFYLDRVEAPARLNNNSDPMATYANQLIFTVTLAQGTEGIDFTTTTDADTDGDINDESTKNHKVIVYYSDGYQQITDLAWTKTAIGKDGGNNILDQNEKFQVTVDLTRVNNDAGWDYKKMDPYHKFTIELKPPKGAVLALERTLPALIKDVNNLN